MIKHSESRFQFGAEGVAIGGYLERPVDELIESQAATALPPVGGYGSARVENFRHRELISIKSARTVVAGRDARLHEPSVFSALATTIVEGLDIMGVVTADRVVARLTLTQKGDGFPEFSVEGSYFQGLRIKGEPISPGASFGPLKPHGDEQQRFRSVSLATIIGRPDSHANAISIPDFGTIYLAELISAYHTAHLTMIRVEFGCAVEGKAAVCAVGGQGHRIP